MKTNCNDERTHFFTKIYLSHFIFDVSVVCERWVETGTDFYIDPSSSLGNSSTSSASWLGLLKRGSLGPLWHSWFSLWHFCIRLTQRHRGHLPIFFFFPDVHLLPLLFRLFTQVHLLIDGSVEGQYITVSPMFWAEKRFY